MKLFHICCTYGCRNSSNRAYRRSGRHSSFCNYSLSHLLTDFYSQFRKKAVLGITIFVTRRNTKVGKVKQHLVQVEAIKMGNMIFRPKEYYEGNKINGKKEGKGRCTYGNGDVYDGQFKNDKRDGLGVLTHRNGVVEEGLFKADKYLGKEAGSK